MDILTVILAFIFGTIIGSFLNVVSLRLNTGVGINGRSKCMSCGTSLTWKELVPLFSFLIQRGSCKKCKSSISWQYPLIEFCAGALFVLIFLVFPPTSLIVGIQTLIYLLISSVVLVICAYDIKHKIIPDVLSYIFAGLSILSLFIGGDTLFHMPTIVSLIAGPLLAVPFALLWLISKGTWMGLGDAKLMLGIGWLLGINGGVNAMILAFWIAAAVSLIWLYSTYKKFKPKTEIPFGPYLILGMYLVLLFKFQVLDLNIVTDLLWTAF